MDVFDRRRERLRVLLTEISAAELARASGVSASYISRCLKEPLQDGYKTIGEVTARRLEKGARKPEGWLDAGPKGHPPATPPLLPGSGYGALDAVATAALVAELARRIKKIPRDQRSFMAQEAAALVMSPDSEETRAALAHYLQFGDERLPTTTTQLHDREPHATEPTADKGNVRS